MHIDHKAGDKLFVDFAGKKLSIIDKDTGEIQNVEVFVAILGASQSTYVEATKSQKKHDFIAAHVNTLRYIGGVPRAIVPDCLKTGVTRGDKYEPDINPEYLDFSQHYGTTILPARPNRPKDKALVEGAVRIVYSRIYAPLQNQVFHSLEELNHAIWGLLEKYNAKPMQFYQQSRRELFEEVEKSALQQLPPEPYVIRSYKQLKVQFNYHVYLSEDRHYYSVPYQYRRWQVQILYTDSVIEIYHNNICIAFHKRNRKSYGYTTIKSHMPPNHQWKDDWNAEKLIHWAETIGKDTKEVIETILTTRQHPGQGYKVCLGILNLAREYGKDRLNKACARSLYYD